MKNSKEILSSVVKTAQMGQTGIRSVLDTSMRPSLRKALESQLREYDSIETEAHTIASQRGWELKELDPGVRMMTDMMTRMNQGNTRGMVKGLKNLHQFPSSDSQVQMVSQKLLDCETANIRQMQGYL